MLKNLLEAFAKSIIAGIQAQAERMGQRIPNIGVKITNLSNRGVRLVIPSFFKYLIHGRGPGKQPPPSKMLSWVRSNPNILVQAKLRYKYIKEKGLAYIVGRSIAAHGTLIYQGKKPGLDLDSIVAASLKELYKQIPKAYGKEIISKLKLR